MVVLGSLVVVVEEVVHMVEMEKIMTMNIEDIVQEEMSKLMLSVLKLHALI